MIDIMTSRKTRQTTDFFLFPVILKFFSVNPTLVKCEFISFRKNENRLIEIVSVY